MPVIKSAKKKLRQDKKRQFANKKTKNTYKDLLKDTITSPSVEKVQEAFSSLDKAAKKGIIHANKAARLKSSLSKLLISGNTKKTSLSEAKKPSTTSKKKASKK